MINDTYVEQKRQRRNTYDKLNITDEIFVSPDIKPNIDSMIHIPAEELRTLPVPHMSQYYALREDRHESARLLAQK